VGVYSNLTAYSKESIGEYIKRSSLFFFSFSFFTFRGTVFSSS
jgi:hypothetical protein